MKYRREIDGLRAVAVLPVILFHGGFSFFSGGYVGVDVFFVISGYLIAALLMRDLERGQFPLLGFYERRARRILPALFAVLLASLVLALVLMPPLAFRDFGQSLVATGLFASNILFWLESGYFEASAELKPLLHTWSLAVEEQYYLLFPLLLAAIWGGGRRRILLVLGAIALVSLGLGEWGSRTLPSAAFYLAPFRVWELLAGAIVAVLLHGHEIRGRNLPSALGLGAILGAMLLFDEHTRTPSVSTLIPVLGTCAVIAFADGRTWAGRVLSLPPMLAIGLISYSAYLWHQPLFAFARIHTVFPPSDAMMLSLSALTLLLAWGTWVFIEQPFRHTRDGPPRLLPGQRGLLSASALGLAVVIGIGGWGHVSDGRSEMWMARFQSDHRAFEAAVNHAQETRRQLADNDMDKGACVLARRQLTSDMTAQLRQCAATHGPGLLILGDSHAVDTFLMATSDDRADGRFVAGLVSGGCRPHDPGQDCAYDDLLTFVTQNPAVFGRILYMQAGFYLMETQAGLAVDRTTFAVPLDRPLPALDPAADRVEKVLAYLEALDAHTPTTWLGPWLEPHIPMELLRRRGCQADMVLRPGQTQAFSALDAYLSQTLAPSQVDYFSVMQALQLQFPEDLMTCTSVFWSDEDHFSLAGAARFAERLRLLNLF